VGKQIFDWSASGTVSPRTFAWLSCLALAGWMFSGFTAVAQSLQTTQTSTIGSVVNYDNNWAQTFSVTGGELTTTNGSAQIQPFAKVEGSDHLRFPNSGTAEFKASVTNLSDEGGYTSGNAQISGLSINSVVLNPSSQNGVPAIVILTSSPNVGAGLKSPCIEGTIADSSCLTATSPTPLAESVPTGASIIGDNIGTESIQVTGTQSTSTTNSLTVF
jgi:hypothetical protein